MGGQACSHGLAWGRWRAGPTVLVVCVSYYAPFIYLSLKRTFLEPDSRNLDSRPQAPHLALRFHLAALSSLRGEGIGPSLSAISSSAPLILLCCACLCRQRCSHFLGIHAASCTPAAAVAWDSSCMGMALGAEIFSFLGAGWEALWEAGMEMRNQQNKNCLSSSSLCLPQCFS